MSELEGSKSHSLSIQGQEDSERAEAEVGIEDKSAQKEVGWENDDDPENPQNWTLSKKAINIGIVCILAFVTPMASSTIGPAIPLVVSDLHETRKPVVALVVSIYVLGFAFGPLVTSPLSELYGRRLIYNISNVVHLAFTIGCALAPNMAVLIVFRFIAGCFGATSLNVAGGSIADQVPLAKRGAVMTGLFAGIFLGPVIGPVIGGFLAQGAGWRWIFWLLVIMIGVMTVLTFFFLTESHGQTILRRKAERLNKENPDAYSVPVANVRAVLLRAILRPMRMLIRSPIVTGLSIYLALIYGYLYLLFTTFSTVFADQYGFDTGILGLAFLGLGVGMIVALAVLSWLSDWLQEKSTKKHGESKPEYRLLPLIFGIPFLPIGLFGYGWTAQYAEHWMVPIFFTSLAGVGLIFSFVPTQIYMVDAFTKYAASALAATSVVRSIFGGCLPIAGLPMYSTLGYGWGNSLLGFLAIIASVAPFLFLKYGEKLRTKYEVSFD
ncbi:major facilitator superfamily domain-containing protein [Hypoxylon trugodes]|uniref:major facilitator superfamily domain-containing protein n=1 Tax=Hypoxylon trugodes TaxID=326681 RepID=UPI002190D47B|nr:major facilitator superfamily domain-containing protein [Hypoxylon trugodes]KAI1384847.1 major facilitator superfamily domain-containing protein [Hypoxylon trugodes]